jgi:hypothetical protein
MPMEPGNSGCFLSIGIHRKSFETNQTDE